MWPLQDSRKCTQIWYFWFENMPFGNPAPLLKKWPPAAFAKIAALTATTLAFY
jgi:hypothetical protein